MKMEPDGGSLLSVSNHRLGIIGNPENRRIFDFQNAMEEIGFARPVCLSYEHLLSDPHALETFDPDFIRIDSPGENPRVAKALIALGGGPRNVGLEFGEISYLKEYHIGFCNVLQSIADQRIPSLNAPSEIAVMFDKWECHQVFLNHGLPRPESELAPLDVRSFMERVSLERSGRVFLKPLHGSSSSGVCAFRWLDHRLQLIAPLRIQSKRGKPILVNSLRVQTYTSPSDINLIFGILLPQGMIVERWIAKFALPGGAVDLRVLVINGEARHWVARQSRSPMTNLHLGNRRADSEQFKEVLGSEKLSNAFYVAEQAARCFPRSLYAGVDVLIDSHGRPFVGEINAFGDLLPRLTHRGESAYEAIARACYAQCCLV
jgi:hypothetical protein